MYKVFFNNHMVYLANKFPNNTIANIFSFDDMNFKESIPQWLGNKENKEVFIQTPEPESSWAKFCDHFKLIEAAGGMVKNTVGKYLFIYRMGCWDLPKGKREPNEQIEECAIREIEEECGISGIQPVNKITETYHTYEHKGKFVLKKTYWYSFTYKGKEALVPQTEEDITAVKWCGIDEMPQIQMNTYPSIIEVIEKAFLLPEFKSQ